MNRYTLNLAGIVVARTSTYTEARHKVRAAGNGLIIMHDGHLTTGCDTCTRDAYTFIGAVPPAVSA
jgi:hypothetical protein